MFDQIKKVFFGEAKESTESLSLISHPAHNPLSKWAAKQGMKLSLDGAGPGLFLDGRVRGKPWRLQLGSPTRKYIRGYEVRARAELDIDEDLSVLVISRPLQEALEKQVYQMYTDSLQTLANPGLPEEVRWLSTFEEVGWESLPRTFWHRYSVLTDRRENALAWIDQALCQLMQEWPEPAPSREVPFMIMLLRGKAYLRMEYNPAELATLRHAALIFTNACEGAMSRLPVPPPQT
jgi:hypothetical protein